eukprot:GFUD01024521.1.p1 GENE.GFUD01024521.1~~GFUD01024521.1.p1  ORF type:complete len:440 (-),score=140.18 GFUD01024521.1:448-1767(-)
MAYGGVHAAGRPVLLGFVDEFMETDREYFTTNKIGGSADWCTSVQDPPVPLCGECGSALLLVTQIYAPLSGSLYHRTLYIFGCIQTRCWNKSSSWACLRSQVLDKPEVKVEAKKETIVPMAATDWLGDADDWGDDPNDNDDNGNFSSISPDTSSPSPVGAVGGFPTANFNLNDKLINATVGEDTLDIPMNNLNIKDTSVGSNLNDTNANISPPGRGASAPSGTSVTAPAATAEIEMEGEDSNIAIDSPLVGNTNIPHLFATASREVSSMGLKIEPFYIWVQEESLTPKMSEHEMSLLMEYKAKEALDHVVESSGKGGNTGGDTYEKTVPSHGDEFFHKFISIIQNNPGQILRYGRDSQSAPLLLRPLKEETHTCTHCGADSIFELQLLPSLVTQLRVAGLEGLPLEFGTVLVMACQRSCWSDTSGQPRFEKVLVQAELM